MLTLLFDGVAAGLREGGLGSEVLSFNEKVSFSYFSLFYILIYFYRPILK